MSLHGLTQITVGVPNIAETLLYYHDFGLAKSGASRLATTDGGDQLVLVGAPKRRLIEMRVGADHSDDLARIAERLTRRAVRFEQTAHSVSAIEPAGGFTVTVHLAPRMDQPQTPAAPVNGPGRVERVNDRAPVLARVGPAHPRRLGHVVVGSTDLVATSEFFTEGIGFRVSDRVVGAAVFLRCSSDHHNVLIQQAPVNFLHHTSWQVQDVDEVGRGAMLMLDGHPERHVWGLGRHFLGSNFFWYLRDPAGNFTEYYSDMDCIVGSQLWEPGVFELSDDFTLMARLHPRTFYSLQTSQHG